MSETFIEPGGILNEVVDPLKLELGALVYVTYKTADARLIGLMGIMRVIPAGTRSAISKESGYYGVEALNPRKQVDVGNIPGHRVILPEWQPSFEVLAPPLPRIELPEQRS